jgi:hypothetical protein
VPGAKAPKLEFGTRLSSENHLELGNHVRKQVDSRPRKRDRSPGLEAASPCKRDRSPLVLEAASPCQREAFKEYSTVAVGRRIGSCLSPAAPIPPAAVSALRSPPRAKGPWTGLRGAGPVHCSGLLTLWAVEAGGSLALGPRAAMRDSWSQRQSHGSLRAPLEVVGVRPCGGVRHSSSSSGCGVDVPPRAWATPSPADVRSGPSRGSSVATWEGHCGGSPPPSFERTRAGEQIELE